MSSVLLADLGNTTSLLAFREGETFVDRVRLPTAELCGNGDFLLSRLREHAPESACYASVAPTATACLRRFLEEAGVPVCELNYQNVPGLALDYPRPEEIGQDRLANALGAAAHYPLPAIVIDMGTAVTFDVVNESGAYEGGIIAPGFELMGRYLHEQTALLPELEMDDLLVQSAIGKSTVEAMKLGCAIGFTGMIRALLERVMAALKDRGQTQITVIGTGGSAYSLLNELGYDLVMDPDITLKGLHEAHLRMARQGGQD